MLNLKYATITYEIIPEERVIDIESVEIINLENLDAITYNESDWETTSSSDSETTSSESDYGCEANGLFYAGDSFFI